MGSGCVHTQSKNCPYSYTSTVPSPLQDGGTFCSLSSTWQATESSSLLPVQHGQLQLHGSQPWFSSCSFFSHFGSRSSNSANDAPIGNVGLPVQILGLLEGGHRGSVVPGGKRGQPGGTTSGHLTPGQSCHCPSVHCSTSQSGDASCTCMLLLCDQSAPHP